mmetsp:Transcript_110978/g.353576  ORF Transcript_110978/g.353576 Transcript_110978/m.353576 type:complete len:244 (+) Transcript_110978:143-874(+)
MDGRQARQCQGLARSVPIHSALCCRERLWLSGFRHGSCLLARDALSIGYRHRGRKPRQHRRHAEQVSLALARLAPEAEARMRDRHDFWCRHRCLRPDHASLGARPAALFAGRPWCHNVDQWACLHFCIVLPGHAHGRQGRQLQCLVHFALHRVVGICMSGIGHRDGMAGQQFTLLGRRQRIVLIQGCGHRELLHRYNLALEALLAARLLRCCTGHRQRIPKCRARLGTSVGALSLRMVFWAGL